MEKKPGSMGKPVPGFDVDIVDDQGTRLDPDLVGHIAIRCSHDQPWPPGLFRGYLTSGGELDTKPFRNGWYYTGDMARKDRDGYIWFEVGRSERTFSL